MLASILCEHDIVIDTNVLSHSENLGSTFQISALDLLRWVQDADVIWILDDNGKKQPEPETSLLYAEYIQTLSPQSLALQVLTHCMSSGRVAFAPRPNEATRNTIRRLIPKNVKDRAVLGAAVGTSDRVLISNDHKDFSDNVRKKVKKTLDVDIFSSPDVEHSTDGADADAY